MYEFEMGRIGRILIRFNSGDTEIKIKPFIIEHKDFVCIFFKVLFIKLDEFLTFV